MYIDDLKIDGYELSSVSVDNYGFSFSYYPVKQEDEVSSISITFDRPESWQGLCSEEIFKIRLEQAESQGWGELTEDDMIYSKKFVEVSMRMEDTIVIIRDFSKQKNYEELRDLANQVIKTAELVDVEYELDVMRRSEN